MDLRDAKILQKTLTVKYDGNEYEFKIPSFKDRLEITQLSQSLQSKYSPRDVDDMGGMMFPDLATGALFDAYAAFKHLLVRTSATWVFGPDANAKPTMDIGEWPSDAPVMEVVGEFYKELATFRKGGDKPAQ